MKIVARKHLDEITRLQLRQTDVACRLGVIVREVVKMAVMLEPGPETDARVGAHVLQHWPQAKQLLAEHEDLLVQQQEAGLAALASVGLDPSEPGQTYRIEEDGRAVKLAAGVWVEA